MIFIHHNEPYGSVTFTVEKVTPVADLITERSEMYSKSRAQKGWVQLEGVVTKGGVTSYLLGHTHTRSLVGQRYIVQVPPADFERGSYTSVAM